VHGIRLKVQDLMTVSLADLDVVHFDPNNCKLHNKLFAPYTPIHNVGRIA
jgi:hypothetical protein